MNYVYINQDKTVQEIIPAFDPRFPGVPVEKRYSKSFLNRCLEVQDGVEVKEGYEYIPIHNVFAPALQYTGDSFVNSAEGSKTISVEFSKPGAWNVLESDIDGIERMGDSLMIPQMSEGKIKIRYKETDFEREMETTISVYAEQETPPN